MPDIVALILDNQFTLIAARVLLTLLFWMAGFYGVFNFSMVLKEMEEAGLRHPKTSAVATIICQLVGSALLITNLYGLGWLGAGALGVFTLLSIPLGHPFWKFEEPRKTHEFQIALEHVTVVGGLLTAAILTYKID
ncbi:MULTISPECIES: DoxX family protein [unclassified Thalassospira]|uniref:DoxX family protein n=1 Tax=unclassified Thalassospira TaxID=2648997 RepID=UPI000EDF6972|nr:MULTISPECIES: DoxX family protein [unclassified Thalassospira]HAI29772.1 hypothetical protein [Thalassospira sp.]|tara:strand:- start:16419 stop:16826 length:408 start_codon:yes stop_codon:yes gene_type:complete